MSPMSIAARTASATTLKSQFSRARMDLKDYQQLTAELGLVAVDQLGKDGQTSIIIVSSEREETDVQDAVAFTDVYGVKREIDDS